MLHSERVSPEDFETDHFRTQLAERVAWAVEDAVSAAGVPRTAAADSDAVRREPAHAA